MAIDRQLTVDVVTKRPGASKDFAFEWVNVLVAGATITPANSTWVVPAPLVNANEGVNNDTETFVQLSGGVEGGEYDVVNTVVSSAGNTHTRTLRVLVSGSAITLVEDPTNAAMNTYLSLAEAAALVPLNLFVDAWLAATTAAREIALVQASRLLDEYCAWNGGPASTDQPMRWPREKAYSRDGILVDSSIVPGPIKTATFLLANHLLTENPQSVPDTQGITSMSMSGLSMTFDKRDRKKLIPEDVKSALAGLGVPSGYGNVVGVVRA